MKKNEVIKRYIFFIIGLFVNSFGVSFITKANLGTSPISSIPYTLSLGFRPSLGEFTLYMSIILIIIQIILLRKNFPKQYYLQIPVSVVFSYFIDLTMTLLGGMNPESYFMKLMSLLFGCIILGIGVFIEMVANVVMLPGESFVNAVSKTFHTDFGKTKVAFDSSMAIIACILGLIFYHEVLGVREGTVIAAILVGMIARFLKRKIGFIEEKWLIEDSKIEQKQEYNGIVITVSREFGSGGRKIAERLAKQLNFKFHDNDIMVLAAKETGMTAENIESSEQNISNRFLYDMFAQEYDLLEQESLQDKLSKAENKIILNFAKEGDCVIVGRCADIICRDIPNCYNIFLYADENYKINEVMSRENISFDEAKKKVRDINRKRANHYKYYTEKVWKMSDNYDLCINSSKLSEDQVTKLIQDFVSK